MKQIIFVAAVIAVSLTGCKKDKYQEKGNYQPAGNYAGASSEILTLSNSYRSYFNGVDYTIEANAASSKITADIIDNGAVLVYLVFNNGTFSVIPLSVTGANFSYSYNAFISENLVTIYRDGFDTNANNIPTATSLDGVKIKVVTITGSGLKEHPDVDLENYYEVKEAFHI